MKQLLTITGMFNDEFTEHINKECSISVIVDVEEDCKCDDFVKCGLCKLIETGILTDL